MTELTATSIVIDNLNDTLKLNNAYSEIDEIEFRNISLKEISLLQSKRIKSLSFIGCIGSINSVLEMIDRSKINNIYIYQCNFQDKHLNLNNVRKNNLKLEIKESILSFKIVNTPAISSLSFIDSKILWLDFLELNKLIKSITIINTSSYFCSNIESIKNLTKLSNLRLEFKDYFYGQLDLNLLSDLEYLFIDNFKYFPKNVGTESLKALGIRNTYLGSVSKIDSIVNKNKNLEELYLNFCNLTSIPKNIYNLNNLRTLSLSNNKINSVNDNISRIKNLEELYLDNNYISKFNIKAFEINKIDQINIKFNNLNIPVVNPTKRKIIINQEGNPFVK